MITSAISRVLLVPSVMLWMPNDLSIVNGAPPKETAGPLGWNGLLVAPDRGLYVVFMFWYQDALPQLTT